MHAPSSPSSWQQKGKKAGLSVDRAYSLVSVEEVETEHGMLRLMRGGRQARRGALQK